MSSTARSNFFGTISLYVLCCVGVLSNNSLGSTLTSPQPVHLKEFSLTQGQTVDVETQLRLNSTERLDCNSNLLCTMSGNNPNTLYDGEDAQQFGHFNIVSLNIELDYRYIMPISATRLTLPGGAYVKGDYSGGLIFYLKPQLKEAYREQTIDYEHVRFVSVPEINAWVTNTLPHYFDLKADVDILDLGYYNRYQKKYAGFAAMMDSKTYNALPSTLKDNNDLYYPVSRVNGVINLYVGGQRMLRLMKPTGITEETIKTLGESLDAGTTQGNVATYTLQNDVPKAGMFNYLPPSQETTSAVIDLKGYELNLTRTLNSAVPLTFVNTGAQNTVSIGSAALTRTGNANSIDAPITESTAPKLSFKGVSVVVDIPVFDGGTAKAMQPKLSMEDSDRGKKPTLTINSKDKKTKLSSLSFP